MRYFAAALCALLVTGLTVPIALSIPAAAATTGLVRGTVTLDGKPAAGALVVIYGQGSRFTATTDQKGQYAFPEIPFGSYQVSAHKDPATDDTVSITVSSGSVLTIDVALSTTLKTIGNVAATARAGPSGNPVSVNQVEKAQIQTSPEQNSLYRLMETVPGDVRFSYNEPVALGFHGITYELDGAPLPLATSSNFAEVVDPKQIDSMEVYTGDFPAEYGGFRMGALVNIITDRPSDIPPGFYGQLTGGIGNYSQGLGQITEEGRSGSTEIYLNYDNFGTTRGIDAPTIDPIHDSSSQSDGFFRAITQVNPRSTLAFDFSNQFTQYQIPINTNPNDPNDPQVAPAGTDDVQREYDRSASLNYTVTSQDGLGIFQVIPWYRLTNIVYAGDLPNDVLATFQGANATGLDQNRLGTYLGLNLSDFRASNHHAWKIGLDVDRENFSASQTFACFNVNCDTTAPQAVPYYSVSTAQDQAGANIGAYAQDKWQPNSKLAVDYGLRYDHSTGYVGGWQISPRIGVNYQVDQKNILNAYYGKNYAAPQLEDVREACVLLEGCPPNPVYDLKPESDGLFEIGIHHAFNARLNGYLAYVTRNVVNVLDTTQFLNTPLFAVFNNAIGRYKGGQLRIEDHAYNGNFFYMSATVSQSVAGGVSGSTFLCPPNPPGPIVLAPEDHDQTVAVETGYTALFGQNRQWFGTFETDFGTGYPVAFESATTNLSGRLPSHTTFNLSVGHNLSQTKSGLGVKLDIDNLLDDNYIIKIANGFNTTQYSAGRTVLLRLTAPF